MFLYILVLGYYLDKKSKERKQWHNLIIMIINSKNTILVAKWLVHLCRDKNK